MGRALARDEGKMQLLIVSNSAAEATGLAAQLMPAGISGRHVPLAGAAEAVLDLAGGDGDVAVAIDEPDVAGRVVPLLRRLRGAGLDVPVVVMSAQFSSADEHASFNHGADALVPRATAAATLPARLGAIRRRLSRRRMPVLRCGNVTLDRSAGTLKVNDRPVEVTPCELAVLETLMSARGVTLGKDVLGEHLQHDDGEQGGAILRVFVCRVRRKLAACGADDIIQTVWGVGYRVEAPRRSVEVPVEPRLESRVGSRVGALIAA
jgi:DNA-binding response OmpR family regulator